MRTVIIPGFGMVTVLGLSGTSGLSDHVSAPLPERVLQILGLAEQADFGRTFRHHCQSVYFKTRVKRNQRPISPPEKM
ncbi:hypothetical protein [Lactiplantibacillus carotarum]|uniref:hypothetical protein n=1 Tax=Lactiplantibacillus carotarum TaxID=2993456 RepID=UPI00298EEC25|nr:hypothetical protein [Lactiplantibacillus carotarum]